MLLYRGLVNGNSSSKYLFLLKSANKLMGFYVFKIHSSYDTNAYIFVTVMTTIFSLTVASSNV